MDSSITLVRVPDHPSYYSYMYEHWYDEHKIILPYIYMYGQEAKLITKEFFDDWYKKHLHLFQLVNKLSNQYNLLEKQVAKYHKIFVGSMALTGLGLFAFGVYYRYKKEVSKIDENTPSPIVNYDDEKLKINFNPKRTIKCLVNGLVFASPAIVAYRFYTKFL